MKNNKKTSDAAELMDKWYSNTPDWNEMVAEERVKLEVSQIIYDLRAEAGLSQEALAQLISSSQSIISRLENADYEGSALEMLLRICLALHKPLTVSRNDKQIALARIIHEKRE